VIWADPASRVAQSAATISRSAEVSRREHVPRHQDLFQGRVERDVSQVFAYLRDLIV
jgi:hypothetical protein